MKDSELEAILKNALNDDVLPPPELNAKLMERLALKKKKTFFNLNFKGVAAAAVIVLIATGVFVSDYDFKKFTNNTEISSNVENKFVADNYQKKSETNNSEYDSGMQEDTKTENADKEPALSATEVSERYRSIKSKVSDVKSDSSSNKMSDLSDKKKESTVIASSGTVDDVSSDTEETFVDNSLISGSSDKFEYKYLEIAAEGIGKALDSLNETVNSYLGELYEQHYSYPMVASSYNNANEIVMSKSIEGSSPAPALKGEYKKFSGSAESTGGGEIKQNSAMTENAAEDTDTHEAHNDYQVLTDSKDYYCVRVNTEFADMPDVIYSNTYTVDKKAEAIVTLDDVYSENKNYKTELYENICNQMKERMEKDENTEYFIGEYGFSEIKGDEDFYINDRNDVIITFDKGTVAPYNQGESVFNVGNPNK